MRKLALLLSFFISLTIFGQNSQTLDSNSCYQGEFIDQLDKQKQFVYVFFKGEETAYVLKSKSILSKKEIKKLQEDLSQVKSKGVYKVYPNNQIVVRTNNSKEAKAHQTKSKYANLKGSFDEEGALLLSYSDNGSSAENIVFKLHK